MDAPDVIAKTQELRRRSESLRLDALRARIGAANALCSIAQTQARWESPEASERTLQKVEGAIRGFIRDIDEPRHVRAELREELLSQVAAVEARVKEIRHSVEKPGSNR